MVRQNVQRDADSQDDVVIGLAPGQEKNYCIDIVNLQKSFKRQTVSSGYTSVKSALLGFLKDPLGRNKKEKFTKTAAIKDLTLRVLPGQAVGIIGRNGSGKSTLLKLVTGIYKADKGSIRVNGRLAALIELGAGFHPDFTGRENVYLAAAMFGMSRSEVNARFDQIVAFSELEAVIDDPVRTYSSGMYMRLGFSVAVHTNPDVLLVDEVLAVGDATFTVKCHEKINELKRNGKTLLFVSHDLAAVERWCDEVIWLNQGEVKDRGEPRRVIDHYREFIEQAEEKDLEKKNQHEELTVSLPAESEFAEPVNDNFVSKRWGSKEIEIRNAVLAAEDGRAHLVFHPDDSMTLKIDYAVNDLSILADNSDIVFGIGIHRSDGVVIYGSNTDIEGIECHPLSENGVITYRISRLGLLDGQYRLDLAVHRKDGYPFDYHQGIMTFSVRSSKGQIGVVSPESSWEFATL